MSFELAGASALLTELFHVFTLRADAGISPCGFVAKGGVINEGDLEREKRWSITITLPALTTLELAVDNLVTIDEHPGRLYQIVWAPGPDVINLERQYGAIEK